MKRYRQDQVVELAEILKNNGTISVPTDTVFGVCASIATKEAEDQLRLVKNRPLTKSFPIMCKDIEQVKTIAEVNERNEKIMKAFMPGPLTIILPKKQGIPSYVSGGLDTIAIRLATSDALYHLIEETGSPIFMTSANQSGQKTCENLDEIEQSCPLLDGMMEGEVFFGQASTIVDGTKKDLVILRQGPITLEQLEAAA